MEVTDIATPRNMEMGLFYLLAFFAIPLAWGVILDKVIIRSGFVLIGVFGAIAGLFLILQAQFLAMAQIMIYAVGITLVVVIALMLTNPKLENEFSVAISMHKVPAIIMAVTVFMTIYLSLRSQNWPLLPPEGDFPSLYQANLQELGRALMTTYALPFEFASILLLAALMGAVMLAKSDAPAADESQAAGGNSK
jgi:NADH:ubiquinone oxidoreductase subunit 6 (subunit J)